MSTHLNDDGTISIIADPDATEVVIACTGGHGWIVQGEPFEPEVAGKSATTVSYTHLDVYKRQTLTSTLPRRQLHTWRLCFLRLAVQHRAPTVPLIAGCLHLPIGSGSNRQIQPGIAWLQLSKFARRVTAGMEAALRGGHTDMIGVARPFCLDSDFPVRMAAGLSLIHI